MDDHVPRDQRRLYGELAWTWPLISPKEDYVGEGEEFRQLIAGHATIPVQTLLHLGCGGGHLDFTLQRFFRVTGIDLSQSMLGLARGLNPSVEYLHGDMRHMRLGRLFDAVIIADSISYMLCEDDLRAAFVTAREHLRPGGPFCTYAEFTRERFRKNETSCSAHAGDGVDIAFAENYYDPDPADSTIECLFVTLIRRHGKLEIETDRHLCGIFGLDTWRGLLREVGFDVAVVELQGVPAFACVKGSQASA